MTWMNKNFWKWFSIHIPERDAVCIFCSVVSCSMKPCLTGCNCADTSMKTAYIGAGLVSGCQPLFSFTKLVKTLLIISWIINHQSDHELWLVSSLILHALRLVYSYHSGDSLSSSLSPGLCVLWLWNHVHARLRQVPAFGSQGQRRQQTSHLAVLPQPCRQQEGKSQSVTLTHSD